MNTIVTRHDGPAESVAVPAPDPARSALRRLELLVVGAIGLVGLLLRLRFLGVPLRYDEAFTYQTYAVLPDPRVIALSYTFPNNHILNSLAIHYAIPIFGDGKWALRCPAFLTGVGSVFAAWWAGREVSGPVAAWWAAGLVAVSSPLVDFSGNGRGYELGVFFVLVSVALAARLLRGPGPWAVRGLIATSVLGVWSVPTTAYGLVPLAVWMVGCVIFQAQPNRRARLRQAGRVAGVFILAAGLSGLLLAPLTIQPGWNFVGSLPHTWPAIRGVAQATWGQWWRGAPHPAVWVISLAALASLPLHRRISRPGLAVPLGAALALGLAAVVLFSSKLGPYPRAWTAVLPVFLVVAALGLAALQDLLAALAARKAPAVGRVPPWAWVLLVVAVLGVRAAQTSPAGAEEAPQSDNHLGAWLREHEPGRQLLIEYGSFGPNIDLELTFEHYHQAAVGGVTPQQARSGRVLVVQSRGQAAIAKAQVAAAGGQVTSAPPVLVHDFEYISLYDVAVVPPPAGQGLDRRGPRG